MLTLQNVTKQYKTKNGLLNALDDITLNVDSGQFLVLTGPSGSGKTTLLMTLAGMLRPTAGNVAFADKNIYRMSTRSRALFRAKNVGFVFQMFHLVPYLNITENITLPAAVARNTPSPQQAQNLIERFGLSGRNSHKPSQLSAGEKQRVAIARAMLNNPKIILADEPTGNLDPKNANTVLQHLSDYHKEGGTVIIVTHGTQAQEYAQRTINLENGKIKTDNQTS